MNPLQIQSALENKSQRIETVVIQPRTFIEAKSGGELLYILPHRGYLASSTKIVFELKNVSEEFQLCPAAGILSFIKTATLRVGSTIVCQLNNANKLMAIRALARSNERRKLVDSQLTGMSLAFKPMAGSKMDNSSASKILPGQYGLDCEYEEHQYSRIVPGREDMRPNLYNGKIQNHIKTDPDSSPEYSIDLQTLFPGFFTNNQFPLALVNNNEEIAISIQLSDNGEWKKNERAIFCPTLTNDTKYNAVNQVAVYKLPSQSWGADVENAYSEEDDKAGDTKSIIIKYDVDSNVPKNMSVMWGGAEYEESSLINFTKGGQGSDYTMTLVPARYLSEAILKIEAAGTGYTDGDAILVNPTNEKCNIPCTLTVNGTNNVTGVTISSDDFLKFPYMGGSVYCTISQTDNANPPVTHTDARVSYRSETATIACADLQDGNFAVDDYIRLTNDDNSLGRVMAVTANLPTQIDIIRGTWAADGSSGRIQKIAGNPATNCSYSAITNNSVKYIGGGIGPANYQNYDNSEFSGGNGRLQIHKTTLISDLIHYEDDTLEKDRMAMLKGGLKKIYTDFLNITSSYTSDLVNNYAESKNTKVTRYLSLSNEVVRNLYIQDYPGGDLEGETYEFPANLHKKNPLLLTYCSKDSLKEGGKKIQLVINSVPYYPQQISDAQYMYIEASESIGPLYIPHSAWCASYAAKQLDNENYTTSLQPGFQNLDGDSQTNQFQYNDRKSGITNQLFQGIPQKYMTGYMNYLAFCFEKVKGANVLGNGQRIGNSAVEVNYEYDNTKDVFYNGTSSNLNIYAEVERVFVLSNGVVSTTAASS